MLLAGINKSRDKLPVLDHFRSRHAPSDYLIWKEIKLVMVDFLNKNLINV